jgi:hypothetical protein
MSFKLPSVPIGVAMWIGMASTEIGKAVLQRFTSFRLISVVRLREREREVA